MILWADGRSVVELPDGRRIRGRGLRRPPPPGGQDPEFAVCLLARDPGPFPWEHRWVRWRDFRTPASTDDAVRALQDACERSATQRVEITCGGGVGRTGTALAAVAVLAGVPAPEAVAWVRRRYHGRAAETPWQRRWVLRVSQHPAFRGAGLRRSGTPEGASAPARRWGRSGGSKDAGPAARNRRFP